MNNPPSATEAQNPLLATRTGAFELPPFAAIEPGHFRPAFDRALAAHRAEIDVIAANPDKVAQVKAKPAAIQWFVGQVMKSSGGKANPQAVNDLLKAKLGI